MRYRERAVLKPRALDLHAQGVSAPAIAERLSLPRTTANQWLRDEGIGPAPRTKRDKASHGQILKRLRLKLAELETKRE